VLFCLLSVVLTGRLVCCYMLQMHIGYWMCDEPKCKRKVEFDGNSYSLFNMRRRDKQRRWVVFSRGLLDKLYSFIITARTTYTAATRHLSSDVQSFSLRRQDVVKLGTSMLMTFVIPAEASCCPLCGPDPQFIVIDGQALGCTDPDDVQPVRVEEEVPVLDIAASSLCVVPSPPLRAAITKVLRTSAPLTGPQLMHLRAWHSTITVNDRSCAETAAARLFFRFFPMGSERGGLGKGTSGSQEPPAVTMSKMAKPAVDSSDQPDATAASGSLEAKLRTDADGNLTLGGKGAPAKLPSDSWRDRVGHCAPNFETYPKVDDGAWLHVRPFLQALMGETVCGMFQCHDERASRLLANCLRLQDAGKWRDVTAAVDGIGFLTNFVGWFADEIDRDISFRVALGTVLLRAIDMETDVDKLFSATASRKETVNRGWVNAEYCRKWGGTPTPADYQEWLSAQPGGAKSDMDNPLVSFESFPGLNRVRPGIKDSEALKRRVGYKGKDRHTADVEGDGDACNKAFSIKCGLTQGVFNVVCPHVVTLGFRCLFRAESVGEALSIVLERFPSLPKVIFYDVACKLDKNSLRRVRPILRAHKVRCILDRPHSITHTCSPIYMPDESLGTTAGVATQAAEVSHSIAVANRTSLAYMKPRTYMTHKMVQVAMMNVRKLQRLSSDNPKGENDHVPLAPFFHSQLARECHRGSGCVCQASIVVTGRRETEAALQEQLFGDGHLDEAEHAVDCGADGVADDGIGGPVGRDGDEQAVASVVVIEDDNPVGASGTARPHPGVQDQAGDLRCHAEGVCLVPMSTMPLRAEHVAAVDALVGDRPPSTLVRPVNKAKISLTVGDFRSLTGERWLNDAVMNSFVSLINHRATMVRYLMEGEPAYLPRVFMFNTFFFSRMQERAGLYDYAGVRKWGYKNGLDIGEVDRILIPVNLNNMHWVLVVADIRQRSFLFYDSMYAGGGAPVLGTVRRWLGDEVRARLGDDAFESWELDDWACVVDVGFPRQTDGGSCGVFVMAAADCFSLRAPLSFRQAAVPVLRQRMSVALFADSLTILDGCLHLPQVELADDADEDD